MKRFSFISFLFLLAIPFISLGQLSTSLGFTYGLPLMQGASFDSFVDPNGNIDQANTYYTFGKGPWLQAYIGYDLTPCFSTDLGIQYQLGKNSFTQTTVTPMNEQVYTFTNGNNVILNPSLRYNCNLKKIKPYGRLGLLLPLGAKINVVEQFRGNDPVLMQNLDYESEATISSRNNLGFNGGIGLAYELNQRFSCFVDIGAQFLQLKQDRKTVDRYVNNISMQDELDLLPVSQREFLYEDGISPEDNQDPNQPTVLIQQMQPFSNFGLQAGLRFRIDNKKPNIPGIDIVGKGEPQICRKKNKVNVKSTLWIDDMDIKKETTYLNTKLADKRLYPADESRVTISHTMFVQLSNEFPDDGSYGEPKDSTKRKFRIASDLDVDVFVEGGKIKNVKRAPIKTRGGYENLTIFGGHDARVLIEKRNEDKYTCRYIVFGDPHFILEPSFRLVGFRKSTRIWHYIELEVTPNPDCSINKRVRFLCSSAFPSHRLWLDEKEVNYAGSPKSTKQGHLLQLWESQQDMDLPPYEVPYLLRFMAPQQQKYVRPRLYPKPILDWPK